mmetsp:Transcript_975/g.789  ORF Transcript_975/g.789 Transcript_975/m.789 type:complete len:635 (+) Transcript_975:40-1944(+)
MNMGNNTGSNNASQNIYNATAPLGNSSSAAKALKAQKEKEKKKYEEMLKKKKPEIPIDELCKKDIDPFYDYIDDEDDEFMKEQHEIEYSDINGYPEDTGYEASSWRGSKQYISCKIYYDEKDFKRKSKTALLVWCRAAVSSEDKSKRFIQVNCIELILKKGVLDEDDEKEKQRTNGLIFDPTDMKSFKFKSQYIIPIIHKKGNQRRLKTQLHPRRALLFVFSRQSVTQGATSLELFNLENDGKKIRYTGGNDKDNIHLEPNSIFTFGSDYYLNNECLEQNNLHFITKKLNNTHHEYVLLFHKPEIEQNISSGSKLVIFNLNDKNMNNFNKSNYNNYNNYNYNYHNNNRGTSLNFNSMVWQTLTVGQTYHHNLIDIYPRGLNDKKVVILFRIHHVNLINQDNTPAPPQALGQLDPNSNFNFESWSQIYYVNLDLTTNQIEKIEKFGFKTLPLSKCTDKESNCVDTMKFSQDGKFFALIKQREHNDEALFRIYRTGESNKSEFLCQMTNIDIKPWMIKLRSHFSMKFGYFFTISHTDDDIEKAWMIVAGPNVHGDLQTYRECLREWLYDDAISVIMAMIGLSHRYTLHFDIGYLAGEQMAAFDYNKYLDTMFFGVDDSTYLLFQNNIPKDEEEDSD